MPKSKYGRVTVVVMKFFKSGKCLLVSERNHYTGKMMTVKDDEFDVIPNITASNSSSIADYFILKMIDPSFSIDYYEMLIDEYAKKAQVDRDWDSFY